MHRPAFRSSRNAWFVYLSAELKPQLPPVSAGASKCVIGCPSVHL
jgi:hypothetical protein